MKPQSVFFDFDGVIVESMAVKSEAFRQLYLPYGEAVAEAVVRHHLANGGMSRFAKFRLYHSEFLGIELDESGVAELDRSLSALVEDAVVACPTVLGAEELLVRLSGSGIPLFVVSGTPESELIRIVRRRGLDRYFAAVRGSPRSKIGNIGDLLAEYQLDPSRSLMVGDAVADFDAAVAHGIPFIGRLSGAETPFPPDTNVVRDLADTQLTNW